MTGVSSSLEAILGGLRSLSSVVPLTYASDVLHSIMLRGWDVGQVQVAVDVLVLLAYDALTLLGAAAFVRRQA